MRSISFTKRAQEEYEFWETADKKKFDKIQGLIEFSALCKLQSEGLGKPELLSEIDKHYFFIKVNIKSPTPLR